MLSKDEFKNDLKTRVQRLANLLKVRNRFDVQIAQLRRDIGNLSELVGEQPSDELIAVITASRPNNLPAACRDALLTFSGPATATEIMETILIMGFNPKTHANLLASVQTTLRRMPDVKEAQKAGKKAYILVLPSADIPEIEQPRR